MSRRCCSHWLPALVLAVLVAAPAGAELCTIDDVPAATLLLPYFEVNLGRALGSNTVFWVGNSTASPAVAHVTLWTDWAVPTLVFDIYLTGYDIQTVDLRDIFDRGLLPQTAHARNDPDDTISPQGAFSSESGNTLSSCDSLLPPTPLNPAQLDFIRNAHTGRNVGDGCTAENLGDNIARGYITIDNASECSLLFPGEAGYFEAIANPTNQLWGHAYISDSRSSLAAVPLVHVEAAPAQGGVQTFYARYSPRQDSREPLATTWAARFLNGRVPLGGRPTAVATDLVIWRDTGENRLGARYTCGVGKPSWLPLDETQVVVFDDAENVVEICFPQGNPRINPTCAPRATQRLRLGVRDLAAPFRSGWVYLNLNVAGNIRQSHASTLLISRKIRSQLPAIALTSACEP